MVRPRVVYRKDIHKWPGTLRWPDSTLRWQVSTPRWPANTPKWPVNIPRWLVNIPRWLVNIPRWLVNIPRWLVSTPRWQDSTRRWLNKLNRWQGNTLRWLNNLKWQGSTLRWRNKLIRWLNKLIKWARASSRFIPVGSLFRWLGSPTKCQTSRFRWADILRLVNLFRWEVIPKLDSRKWDSHKWEFTRKLRNLYHRYSQVSLNLQANPSNFPTSQPRGSLGSLGSPRGSPFSSLTNLPQASLSLRRRLHRSPSELSKTNRRHQDINSPWEAVRNRECLNLEAVDSKCLCRRSPDKAAAQCHISDVD